MKRFWYLIVLFVLVAGSCPAWAGEPTYEQGKTIFIETGVDQPDKVPTW
jgi:hypothetical protein